MSAGGWSVTSPNRRARLRPGEQRHIVLAARPAGDAAPELDTFGSQLLVREVALLIHELLLIVIRPEPVLTVTW